MLQQHFDSILDLNSVVSNGCPVTTPCDVNPWTNGVCEGANFMGSNPFPDFNISFGGARGQGQGRGLGYGRTNSNNWFGGMVGTNNGYTNSPTLTGDDVKNWLYSDRGK